MIAEMDDLLRQYLAWIKDTTTLREVDEWVEITTPHLDRHNDFIQIYVKRQDEGYLLSDAGYILGDLEMSGCSLKSPKRKALLNMTLNGFGVRLNNGALEVSASKGNFPLKKHSLIQAMLSVNDLFYLASPTVASIFYEDVVAWLDSHDVRYTPKVKFAGTSGLDHCFDFVIPRSKEQPERILQTITHPARDTAQTLVFSWIDTRKVRAPDSQAYAILNDSERHVSGEVIGAFKNYGISPVLFSQINAVTEELST